MEPLVPCPGCARHVRAGDVCPFCGASAAGGAPRAWPAKRLGRMAVFTFGAALAASGCSEAHTPDDDAGSVEEDAGSIEEDAGRDAGNVFPPYGTPPPDDAGVHPLYGGAPPEE